MSYSDLILEEGVSANFLVVLCPRRILSAFALDSGAIYTEAFTLGYIVGVSQDGVELTEAVSSTLSSGEFFWDNDASTIYVRTSDDSDPSTKTIVVSYELYVSTYDAHFYRIPTDNTTTQVFWDPLVSRSPKFTQTVDDLFFGVLPTQTTKLDLNNADKVLNKHISDSSFNRAPLTIYHWLGSLEIANIKKVYTGYTTDHEWNDGGVSFKVFDSVNVFDKDFKVSQDVQTYSLSDYAGINPTRAGSRVRYVYGVVDGLKPLNIDFNIDAPTTSNNRIYAVAGEGSSMSTASATVASSPASTTTRTYLDSVSGFQVGDSFRADKATDESRTITVVNSGSSYIEHAAFSSGAAANPNTISRSPVGRIEIVQNNVLYLPQYIVDYTTSVDGNGILLVTFDSAVDSRLGMPQTISPSDVLSLRVYGKQNDVTLSASGIGSDDSDTDNLLNAGVILVDVLKRYAGITEDELNIATFQSLVTDASDRLGFAIPSRDGVDFESVKDVISSICSSALISFYQDENLKWAVSRLGVVGAVTKTIEDDEILDNSIGYDFEYSDLYSDFTVNYAFRENNIEGTQESYLTKTAISTNAKYLHSSERSLKVKSLHYNGADAQVLANRLKAIYGERQGGLTLRTKNRFFEFNISDILRVSRTSLPGFDYSASTSRNIDFNTRNSQKALRSVTLTVNDLKGVNDNSGDF